MLYTLIRSGGVPTALMTLLTVAALWDLVLTWRARAHRVQIPWLPARLRFYVDFGTNLGLLGTDYGMVGALQGGGTERLTANLGLMLGTTMLGLITWILGALGQRLSPSEITP